MTSRAGRREWIGLAVLILPILIASMDVSVLFFAVPFIAQDLQPTATQQLWIFDIYGFVLAGLLITMGSLGDRIGRRRLLLIGAVAFSAASLLAAYAQSAEMLIAARAVLGIAGATLMPSTLALIRNLFHDEADRTKAVAIWSRRPDRRRRRRPGHQRGAAGALLVGLGVPDQPARPCSCSSSARRSSCPSRGASARRGSTWLSSLLVARRGPAGDRRHQVGRRGRLVDPCGPVCGRRGPRRAAPSCGVSSPPRCRCSTCVLCRERRFGGSVVVNILAMFAIIGNAVFLTQYLQSVLGFSPLAAALWSLVPSVVVGAAAPSAAVLAPRLGRPVVMAGGFVVSVVGFVMISRVDEATRAVAACSSAPAWCPAAWSPSCRSSPTTSSASPRAERAGSVAGLVETSSELGGALGLALLGSVLAAVYRTQADLLLPAGLPAPAAAEASQTLGGALAVSAQLPADLGHAVLEAGRAAYTAAMHAAGLTAAGVLVLAAVVTLVMLRGSDRDGDAGPGRGARLLSEATWWRGSVSRAAPPPSGRSGRTPRRWRGCRPGCTSRCSAQMKATLVGTVPSPGTVTGVQSVLWKASGDVGDTVAPLAAAAEPMIPLSVTWSTVDCWAS